MSSTFLSQLENLLKIYPIGSIGVFSEDIYHCYRDIYKNLSGGFNIIYYDYFSEFSLCEKNPEIFNVFVTIVKKLEQLTVSEDQREKVVVVMFFTKIISTLENWQQTVVLEMLRVIFDRLQTNNWGKILFLDCLENQRLQWGFTLDYPLPDLEAITSKIDMIQDINIASLLQGLSYQDLLSIYKQLALSDPEQFKNIILEYKQQKFKELGLELLKIPEKIEIGGLDILVRWIGEVRLDFAPAAREAKIPLPKGALLVGPPGTGKTHTAKVCAYRLGFPLINVGVDLVKSRGSEYLKALLLRVEQLGKSVLYFDEIDKFFEMSERGGLQGAKDVLGVLLTWLQEKTSETLVLGTLNRLESLPPELTRVGRFDCLFYVGFPQPRERVQILILYSQDYDPRYQDLGNNPLSLEDWRQIVDQSANYTGSELKGVVEAIAKKKFYNQLPMHFELQDFLEALDKIQSLFNRDTERILVMENRAKVFCLSASTEDTSAFAPKKTDLWGKEL